MDVLAKVHSVQLGKAKTGNPQIAMELYVTSKGRLEGTMLVHYMSLVGGALEITKKQLATCGWNGNLRELHTCKKNQVRVSAEAETVGQNGSERWRVKGIYPRERELLTGSFSDKEVESLQAMLDAGAERAQREPGDDYEDAPFPHD